MIIKEAIICIGCGESALVELHHHWCAACQDDISRINKSDNLSIEVKSYITTNYHNYLQHLINENKKPEYAAEYHTFQETCENFYILKTSKSSTHIF